MNRNKNELSEEEISQFSLLCKKNNFQSGTYVLIGRLISGYDEENVFNSEKEALDFATTVLNEGLTEEEALQQIAKKSTPHNIQNIN